MLMAILDPNEGFLNSVLAREVIFRFLEKCSTAFILLFGWVSTLGEVDSRAAVLASR